LGWKTEVNSLDADRGQARAKSRGFAGKENKTKLTPIPVTAVDFYRYRACLKDSVGENGGGGRKIRKKSPERGPRGEIRFGNEKTLFQQRAKKKTRSS